MSSNIQQNDSRRRIRPRTKQATVTSLRALVGMDMNLVPEGDCVMKSAIIRVEVDSAGRTLHRVFLRQSRYEVGWVLNGCSASCLVCDVRFGTFLRRHHCRSCGLIVCHACSRAKDLVGDLDRGSKTRICDLCVQARALAQSPMTEPSTTAFTVTAAVSEKVNPISEEDLMSVDTVSAQVTKRLEGCDESPDTSCEPQSMGDSSVSDVTNPPFVPPQTDPVRSSTVSPSLIRKLALVGFDGNNNSSDDDDATVTPLHRLHSTNSSPSIVEGDSFLSASGSSLGADSTQRYQYSDSDTISPLSCSVSPIHKRRPVMRTRSSSRVPISDSATPRHHIEGALDLLADLQQEDSPEKMRSTRVDSESEEVLVRARVNRRRSLGEIFGLTGKSGKRGDQRQDQIPTSPRVFSDDDSDGHADLSASGSSLGEDSARRYFHGSDVSTAASFNSMSPCQDIVVHQTFHSPSFVVCKKSPATAGAKEENVEDKENLSRQVSRSSTRPVLTQQV